MRAWPWPSSRLQLTLPSGWYPLPWIMPQPEVRRLLVLLREGLDDVEHAVELEWEGLQGVFGRLDLARSAVALRVPAQIEASEIPGVQAKLGSVRVGLLLHEHAGDWVDVGWVQRLIKPPLLSALTQDLHAGRHPFAGLGLDALPLDELARLTDDPIELLELLDALLGHRLRYAAQGLAREDWLRSLDVAVGDRLAMRLRRIPERALPEAVELAIDAGEQALWSALEREIGGNALAQVGLAWREADDVLVAALARQAGRAPILRRLLAQLPARAWSGRSKAALRETQPLPLPVPRAIVVMPEPCYADVPVVSLAWLCEQTGLEWLSRELMIEYSQQTLFEDPLGKLARSTLAQLRDDALLELDFERGRIHRFDAIDRAAADDPGLRLLPVLVRWVGIRELSPRVYDHAHIAVLMIEIRHAFALVEHDTPLWPLLWALLGDLAALRQDYVQAEQFWRDAQMSDEENVALTLRRVLVGLRLGTYSDPWWEVWYSDEWSPESVTAASHLVPVIKALMSDLDVPQGWRDAVDGLIRFSRPWEDTPLLRSCNAALAVERGDWPRAIDLLSRLDHESDTPAAARARLLWAWTRVVLGDLDLAARTFDELHALATRRGDHVLLGLSEQGRAWIATQTGDPEPGASSDQVAR